jgi:hypothetical protein
MTIRPRSPTPIGPGKINLIDIPGEASFITER